MAQVKQFETDIAIIGSGGAGMAAGIEACDAGASAIAFEMAPEPGGAAIIVGVNPLAEQMLENRLLKKSMIGDGGDEE